MVQLWGIYDSKVHIWLWYSYEVYMTLRYIYYSYLVICVAVKFQRRVTNFFSQCSTVSPLTKQFDIHIWFVRSIWFASYLQYILSKTNLLRHNIIVKSLTLLPHELRHLAGHRSLLPTQLAAAIVGPLNLTNPGPLNSWNSVWHRYWLSFCLSTALS